ncbi:hypothetical protein B296_00025906 [Ensete ventricosum]|uniref:Uncharacterized protein n=1 Tax=Ensete ventricosum TaxID=4639 RepID=A0A426XVW6_ENSVE|nr:hypothetical protein B296_00025906 [Ensete ventricosum]
METTTLCSSGSFSVRYPPRHQLHHPKRCSAVAANGGGVRGDGKTSPGLFGRRLCALASGLSLVSGMLLGSPGDGSAVTQGLLAGRVPGLSEPDENGWYSFIHN